MDKIESQIRDADEASRILNSPQFEAAFGAVREAIQRELEETPTTTDGDDRAHDLRRRLKCLAQVKAALSYRIDTGKLAHREMTLREKSAQGAKRFAKTLSNATGVR